MSERIARLTIMVAAAAIAGCSQSTPSGSADTQSADASGWKQPRTAWGDPDLQGMWPIINLISTPFQRPVDQQGNPIYGDREELTDHGKDLAAKMRSSWSGTVFEKPTDFDTWDRCITRGLPPSMFPFNYNNGIEIIQAPGYVVVRLEMIHEARVIPVDGRGPLDPAIKQWMGESRGHFEGNTLVVETTNFNGLTAMTNVGIPGSPRGDTPTTVNMKITERFTRTDADTIQYEMYVDDPEVLTQPWKARYPMQRDDSYQFFEYACNEDNTAIRNYIVTSRYERAQAAKKQ